MRKFLALFLVLGLLACGLGIYTSHTFTSSDYYRVLNPIFNSVTGQNIDPALVKEVWSINVSGNLPAVGKFSYSLRDLIDHGVNIPGYGNVTLSGLLGRDLNFAQRTWAKVIVAGYGWSHELMLYGGIAAAVMAFLLIGTHRPKQRRRK